MPALFAYLIALCLLLGGGYGALNWLAAPEPVKVAAKARPKPKSPPPYEARAEEIPASSASANSSEASSPETSAAVVEAAPAPDNELAHTAASSANDRPAPEQARPDVTDQSTPPATAAPTPDRQTRSANAEATSHEARRKIEQPVKQTASAPTPGNLRSTPHAAGTIARVEKRPPSRQASNRSERRAPVMMTLRTIEYPDGRRETRLIPYEGRRRALAYQVDE